MQNFSAIRLPVRRPFQKNSWGGVHHPSPMHWRGLKTVATALSQIVFEAGSLDLPDALARDAIGLIFRKVAKTCVTRNDKNDGAVRCFFDNSVHTSIAHYFPEFGYDGYLRLQVLRFPIRGDDGISADGHASSASLFGKAEVSATVHGVMTNHSRDLTICAHRCKQSQEPHS